MEFLTKTEAIYTENLVQRPLDKNGKDSSDLMRGFIKGLRTLADLKKVIQNDIKREEENAKKEKEGA